MIEVEKKFQLTEEAEQRLMEGAAFVSETVFTDRYYDVPDHALTLKGWWLRDREGRFELKVPLQLAAQATDQFQEIEDEPGIREALGLPGMGTLADDLAAAGYAPFSQYTTTRRKYRCEGFTVDLDVAESEGFRHSLGEVELMVSEPEEVEEAVRRIEAFVVGRGVSPTPATGKLVAYLYQFHPAHYEALVRAGVVRPVL